MRERNKVEKKDRWDVESFYKSTKEWEKCFKKALKASENRTWPKLNKVKGKLSKGVSYFKNALEIYLTTERELYSLYTYAHLRHDENIADKTNKNAFERISALIYSFGEKSSWLAPETLALPQKTIKSYLQSPSLKKYEFHVEKILLLKKHSLSADKEELIAKAEMALSSSGKAFSALNDADLGFGSAKDKTGKERKLTHSQYGLFIRSKDRTLRKNSFKKFHSAFLSHENTFCELINGQIQSNLFYAKTHNYDSCLEAALQPNNIPTKIYTNLIEAVGRDLTPLHKYVNLRKKALKLKKINLYDMYVPLTSAPQNLKISYEKALEVTIESVKPLGKGYQKLLENGLKKNRWVDKFENKSKRSGAYSSGCYDSYPYILMNFNGSLNDVFTLAHEAGHSMHSLLSRKNQEYHYASYPIFVAEVASTFNEELLLNLMLSKATKKEEKILLINQKIENIRGTLFRQTMFAEFELFVHGCAENHIPLTPQLLKEKYRALNKKYFGKGAIIDDEIDIEWARIPHFYYNFYVYQYATGISAAISLANGVLNGGKKEREAYLNFLKGGCSNYPIDLLKGAGADMSSSEPIETTIKIFDKNVNELKKLL